MHYHSAEANSSDQKSLRKMLRNRSTPEETILWKALRGRGAGGFKFRRQQGIGNYILDFYCPELKLCVEVDGSSHDLKYADDELRTSFLREQGIVVIRFTNEMVRINPLGVVEEIVGVARKIKGGLAEEARVEGGEEAGKEEIAEAVSGMTG